MEAEEKAVRYVAKAGRRFHARCPESVWISVLPFIWARPLTYDHVLEVLGAVDTEVFSRLLRSILANDIVAGHRDSGGSDRAGTGVGTVCDRFYLVPAQSSPGQRASDEMEDVLDMSSENLAILKEEADMIEADADHALYPHFF